MNIRKIVTYNALRRQFTADELAFADVLYNATESEREMLINALQPEKPAGKKASKKSSKSPSAKSTSSRKRGLPPDSHGLPAGAHDGHLRLH